MASDERARRGDGAEQRRYPRTDVTLFVDYDGAEDFLGDYTENLSLGGTFIHTSRAFEIGSSIQLVLAFPGLLEPVTLDAVVRWSRPGPEIGVGVEFCEGPGRDRMAALVARLQQGSPGTIARVIRMLVAEDNAHVSSIVRDGLATAARRNFRDRIAFTFVTAETGADALRHLETERFDAALIDVYLPVLDGARVIAHARRELGLVDLPIVAVSAGGESARSAALRAGANAFLDKPMRLHGLLATLRQLLALDA